MAKQMQEIKPTKTFWFGCPNTMYKPRCRAFTRNLALAFYIKRAESAHLDTSTVSIRRMEALGTIFFIFTIGLFAALSFYYYLGLKLTWANNAVVLATLILLLPALISISLFVFEVQNLSYRDFWLLMSIALIALTAVELLCWNIGTKYRDHRNKGQGLVWIIVVSMLLPIVIMGLNMTAATASDVFLWLIAGIAFAVLCLYYYLGLKLDWVEHKKLIMVLFLIPSTLCLVVFFLLKWLTDINVRDVPWEFLVPALLAITGITGLCWRVGSKYREAEKKSYGLIWVGLIALLVPVILGGIYLVLIVIAMAGDSS